MNLLKKLGVKKESRPCLMHIPLDRLVPNPLQPRSVFDNTEIVRLAENIKRNGVLQPLCVRLREELPVLSVNGQTVSAEEKYEIIAGERRWRAARLAGLASVPCLLLTASAGESAHIALAENMFRQDLDYFEQASAMRNIMLVCGLTQSGLAQSLGVSQPTVANKLRLLRFSEEERRIIKDCRMPERQARAFLRITDGEERKKLLRSAEAHGLTPEECEAKVEQYLKGIPRPARVKSVGGTQKLVGAISDIKFFMNSLDKAVCLACAAGFAIEREETDGGEFMELRLKIPKKRAKES